VIPYGRQDITDADIEAVVSVLRSDFLTQGPTIGLFEDAVASYCGAQHAVALNSGTSGLHVACLALGLRSGDWLWTSPISFVASANCGLYCGAKVDFVDVDRRTGNMCAKALAQKLAEAERQGRLPKVIVPVHFCGQSCDMAHIHELATKYGCHIIEDASHAIGGKYRGEPIGSCRYSDITVFSFHPVKIITTAEGGMALSNDFNLAERMSLLRSHGITRNAARMSRAPEGPWFYEQIDLGFNYRMTDIQAALGLSQMKRLDAYVERRNALARRYDDMLSELPLTLPWCDPDTLSAVHLYIVRVHERSERSRKEVFNNLRAAGIGVNVHYIPVHTQPHYLAMGFRRGEFPEAEAYYAQAISLPMYPTLTEDQQDQIVLAAQRALF
jgi:UDP-4-amino-4,6-dideoxy-N-acetyl-beta-L-altrosamine transaminase